MKVYWQDVERVKNAHPKWGYRKIAQALGCGEGYVRATFYRKGWPAPPKSPHAGGWPRRYVRAKLPIATIFPLCIGDEDPQAAMDRIVRRALQRAA